MSHVVVIKSQLRDAVAITVACRRLGLPEPVLGTAKLYSGEVSGLLVHLRGWEYPIAINAATGEIQGDNFEGNWGDPQELARLKQIYALEKIHLESRKRGLVVTETQLEDGSIQLQLLEGA
jgi:hypothetical protein